MSAALEKIIRPVWRPSQFVPPKLHALPSSAGDEPLLEWGGPGNFHDKKELPNATTEGIRNLNVVGTRPSNFAEGNEVERSMSIKTYVVENRHMVRDETHTVTMAFFSGNFPDAGPLFGGEFASATDAKAAFKKAAIEDLHLSEAQGDSIIVTLKTIISQTTEVKYIPVITRVEVDIELISSITFEIPRMPFKRPSTQKLLADAEDTIIDTDAEEFAGYHRAFLEFKFKQ